MTVVRFESASRQWRAELSQPLSIAIPLDFNGPQPAFAGAAAASARPLRAGGFTGDTRAGGSCNCEQLTLVPHCNGTHTECLGHVTDDRVALPERLRGGLMLARLVTVTPVAAAASGEDSDPLPQSGDRLVTAAALSAAAGDDLRGATALVVRTLPNGLERLSHRYEGDSPAPFLSRQAAEWLVATKIMHVVLDLPSADRAQDQGRLCAHRIFFGLPPGSRHAREATRPDATITELAWIAPTIHDGWYLLDLQVPAFLSDAAPSRPLLYPAQRE